MPRPAAADPAVPVPLRLPRTVLDRVDTAAEVAGVARTAWLRSAVDLALAGGQIIVPSPAALPRNVVVTTRFKK